MQILVLISSLFLSSSSFADVISSTECPMSTPAIDCEVGSFSFDEPVFTFNQDGLDDVHVKVRFRYICTDGISHEPDFNACFLVPSQLQYDKGTGNLMSGEDVILKNEDGILSPQVRSEVWFNRDDEGLWWPEIKLFNY